MSELRQNFRQYLFERTLAELSRRYPTLSRKERRDMTRGLVEKMWDDYKSLKTSSPEKIS